MQKHLLVPARLRRIPRPFSWVDPRLVRDHYLERCDAHALALYLFLIAVADAQGVSYYGETSIGRLLTWSATDLNRARQCLVRADLIAFESPLYQVLDIQPVSERPCVKQSVTSPPPPSEVCSRRTPSAAHSIRSIHEVLEEAMRRGRRS